MEGQVPLEKGLKGTNDPTKPRDLEVKPNQSMRERLHEPQPERKIMDRERCPTHFKSSPKSIIDLHHFRKEAWYVESLSKWRNLQNVLRTSLEKRPILVDLSRCVNWLENVSLIRGKQPKVLSRTSSQERETRTRMEKKHPKLQHKGKRQDQGKGKDSNFENL